MKAGPRKSNPNARLLDITRLISRVGRPLTGVDRVESAYLKRLVSEPVPLFCLARTSLGYVLLNQTGTEQIFARLDGRQDWGSIDLLGKFSRSQNRSPQARRAVADCRRLSVARCRPAGLIKMLGAFLPKWTVYLNVGHSNLDDATIKAITSVRHMEFVALLHDTIPLDFPLYQRKGTVERFRKKLSVIGKYADLVITNSQHTDQRFAAHCKMMDRTPPSVISHLGVEISEPDSRVFEAMPPDSRPYFVTVGTIEPRKNHRLLLDVWKQLADGFAPNSCPRLVIAGQRGWNNEEVFAELDRLATPNSDILEFDNLSDGMITALLTGSRGLLFPSRAEGYGIPPIEAALLGVPSVCADLDVYKEVLKDIPIYLDASDQYAWFNEIKALTQIPPMAEPISALDVPPTWEAHFDKVLELI